MIKRVSLLLTATAMLLTGISAAAPQAFASDTASGMAMPTGNLPGWTQDFSDDFTTGPNVDWRWGTYRSAPSGGGYWDPSHDTIQNGVLNILGFADPTDNAKDAGPGTYVTGGVSTSPDFSQTYGKYLVRMRMDPGQGVSVAVLLWPENNQPLGEIDFAEDFGNNQSVSATVHSAGNTQAIERTKAMDLGTWNTFGVQWSPGEVQYTLNGQIWSTVRQTFVPKSPMALDIQTQAWACGAAAWELCANSTTPSQVNLQVAWVVAYSYTPGTTGATAAAAAAAKA